MTKVRAVQKVTIRSSANSKSQVEDGKPKYKTKITLKKRECRCLLAQINALDPSQVSSEKCIVAELFSPPRFTVEAQKRGFQGVAYDIKNGWNLSDPEVQKQVDKQLDQLKPDLLVACPPCTHRGGWEHLNRCYRSM